MNHGPGFGRGKFDFFRAGFVITQSKCVSQQLLPAFSTVGRQILAGDIYFIWGQDYGQGTIENGGWLVGTVDCGSGGVMGGL
jgi:hypothetical protein